MGTKRTSAPLPYVEPPLALPAVHRPLEHCPNFRTGASFLPILLPQRTDADALAADALAPGWGDEVARHRRLIERIDIAIAKASAS